MAENQPNLPDNISRGNLYSEIEAEHLKWNSNVPASLDLNRTVSFIPEVESASLSVPLSHYIWLFRCNWWKILLFVVCSLVATLIISARLVPIYEATATIDIDRQIPSEVVGQENTRIPANDADQFLATQVKLIQSDAVLRPVAQQYDLLALEGQKSNESGNKDSRLGEGPVVLKKLNVTRPTNTYLLQISYRSPNPQIASDVANAIARSYLDHTFELRFKSSAYLSTFMEKQLEELKAKMERSSDALARFEREFNVVDPEEKTSILSSRLLQLNTEYTNAQADRVRKEAAYNSVNDGSIEAAQASTQGDDLKKLASRRNELQQKFAEIKGHYGPNHPEYIQASSEIEELERQLADGQQNIAKRVASEYGQSVDRESMLKKAVAQTKADFDNLNSHSFEYQSLKREAEADKSLYQELIRRIKEASINSGFQNSEIRIADVARAPVKAIFPNYKLNSALAILFSMLFAVGATVIRDMLNKTVRDTEEISRGFLTEVVGTLPLVKDWHRNASAGNLSRNELEARQTSDNRPLAAFQEAILTVRNSIFLTDFDRRLRTLMLTSSEPGEGKSTIAASLAMANAEQGRRTLLIDGDLRRPSIHRYFNISNAAGLSTVLTSGVDWRDLLVGKEGVPMLDILPAGPSSRRAVDLLGIGLSALLESASSGDYDLVLLDSPPLLGFPEPMQMSTNVDGVLVVALAGSTHRKALGATINTLRRLRANVIGVVLNEVRADSSENTYYYHKKYYRYYNTEVDAKA